MRSGCGTWVEVTYWKNHHSYIGREFPLVKYTGLSLGCKVCIVWGETCEGLYIWGAVENLVICTITYPGCDVQVRQVG